MNTGNEHTLHGSRYSAGHQTHVKILMIIFYLGNANCYHKKLHFVPTRMVKNKTSNIKYGSGSVATRTLIYC